ncbi:hypothetical protein RND81_02G002000 [Saponaria officinalis]|uniref:Uncharacterized protein n=1 Tax=Saponaria officinalis TaxID=3572 RepID=A0AAW1MNS0_SAPOF
MGYEEGELLVDLECGGGATNATATSSSTAVIIEKEGIAESRDYVSSCRIGRKPLSRGSTAAAISCNAVMGGGSNTDSRDERIELLIDKCSACEETRDVVGEKRKKHRLKNYSKPPRPPKGPLLNASDLKLVKELSETAARKRARIERMKALKKMKQTKRPTSNTTLPALVITLLFFIVIIFQGALSRSNTREEVVESPAPATTNEGFISVRVLNNGPTNNGMNQPSSLSFK